MSYELTIGNFPGDPRDYFLKWGDNALGTASGEITWSLSLAGLDMSGYAMQLFVDAAEAVFDTWAEIARLTFQYVDGDADIDVVARSAAQEPGLAGNTIGLAEYYFTTSGGFGNRVAEIFEATVYMDTAEQWSPNGEGGYLSYFAVLLHEVGHALGLEHVNDESEIMNPFITANELGDGDIAGMRALYGTDRFFGGDGGNTLTLAGGQAGGAYFAQAGDDDVTGSALADLIYGGLGDDTLRGAGGHDVLIDTAGANTIEGGSGNDRIVGGLGTLTADGGADDDMITGGIGDDTLDGGAGNDALRGDPRGFLFGNDRLIAGAGDDLLEGGGGADVFVFVPAGGDNTIAQINAIGSKPRAGAADYEAGLDAIDLSAFGYVDQADAEQYWTNVGRNAVFDDQGTQITVVGTLVDELDFLL